jgi:CelD/BcsL family acetyltransferase involved in cellulose biosynthesis
MLLPLCVSSKGPISRLTWLGGRLTDYHAPLLYKGFSGLVDKDHFRRIWKDIVRILPVCDVIDLQKQPKFVGDQINPFYYLNIQSHASCAHYTRLTGDINQFLASKRSNRWISNENRKMRNLSKQGALRFREITTPEELNEFLPIMLNQKSESYRRMGTEDIFADNKYRNFVQIISENHLADGFVRFFVLMLGESVIATHWGLLYRQRLYSLLPTYDYGDLNKYSPGTILFRYLFEWCIQHNVEIFDFTTGDEPYKDLWCDQELPLFDYLVPTTARGLLYTPLVKAWRRAKASIKKTPFIYEVAKKLRKKMVPHFRPKR